MKKKLVLLALACSMTLVISACNTVRGVGQDLESAADTVDNNT